MRFLLFWGLKRGFTGIGWDFCRFTGQNVKSPIISRKISFFSDFFIDDCATEGVRLVIENWVARGKIMVNSISKKANPLQTSITVKKQNQQRQGICAWFHNNGRLQSND